MKIVNQQKGMIETGIKSIPNRIVSFYEQSLRPIYRGKMNSITKFSNKVSIIVGGQALIIPGKCTYDNVSDTNLPSKDLQR